MKRHGIINADLAARCARLGHTQLICVADSGLPIPPGVPVVDLALVPGIPEWRQVLDVLIEELVFEGHVVAEECETSPVHEWVADRADSLGEGLSVPHDAFKHFLPDCAFVVRTGEATPYSNIILRCGVPF